MEGINGLVWQLQAVQVAEECAVRVTRDAELPARCARTVRFLEPQAIRVDRLSESGDDRIVCSRYDQVLELLPALTHARSARTPVYRQVYLACIPLQKDDFVLGDVFEPVGPDGYVCRETRVIERPVLAVDPPRTDAGEVW